MAAVCSWFQDVECCFHIDLFQDMGDCNSVVFWKHLCIVPLLLLAEVRFVANFGVVGSKRFRRSACVVDTSALFLAHHLHDNLLRDGSIADLLVMDTYSDRKRVCVPPGGCGTAKNEASLKLGVP